MIIWLIKDGENLPIFPSDRKMRMWLLAEELLAQGHDVVWWSSSFYHQKKILISDRNSTNNISDRFKLNLLYAGSYKKNISVKRYLHHIRFAFNLSLMMKKSEKPDFIVCAYPIVEVAFIAMRFANRANVPFVVDIRDKWPFTIADEFTGWKRSIVNALLWFSRTCAKDIFSNSLAVFSVTPNMLTWARNFGKRYHSNEDSVFPLGYSKIDNSNRLSPVLASDYSFLNNKFVVTFVGTFGRTYDFDAILKVANKLILNSRGRDILFVLAGVGEQFDYVQEQAKDMPNVFLTGWLDSAKIDYLLRQSDVGIIPATKTLSNFDVMPNKPFEYMAYGLPIISSLLGEMSKFIKDNLIGMNYIPENAQSLFDALLYLSEKIDEKNIMSDNALRLFNSDFNANKVYSTYVAKIVEIQRRYCNE